MVHKIVLNGFGRIGKILFAGTDSMSFYGTKPAKLDIDFDILKMAKSVDNKILVRAYREVIKKYYPEKDILIKNK